MRFNLLACLLLSSTALGDLVWLKEPVQVAPVLQDPLFRPTGIIMKMGVFNRMGKLTPAAQVQDTKGVQILCKQGNVEWTAWIAHRLSPKETMTAEAGQALGKELTLLLKGSCFQGVELDVEPLPQLPDWFLAFASGVRKTLSPKLRLSAAIPVIAKGPLKGLSWTPAMAKRLLTDIDGVDIMVYDTGAATSADYIALAGESLAFAEMVATRIPGKYVRLGFPAYQEKTRLHRPDIENVKAVGGAMVKFKGDVRNTVCSPRVSFAYYAGWTMTDPQKQYASTLRDGRRELCQK